MAIPSDADYMAAARRKYHHDGECEIDAFAAVSRSIDDPADGECGAYVEAWVWVAYDEATPEPPPAQEE